MFATKTGNMVRVNVCQAKWADVCRENIEYDTVEHIEKNIGETYYMFSLQTALGRWRCFNSMFLIK
jgi:hypothetical protein